MILCAMCISLWTFDTPPARPKRVCVAREVVAGVRVRCLIWMEER